MGQSDHEEDSRDKTSDEEIRGPENEARSRGLEWDVTGEPQDNGRSPRKSWTVAFPKVRVIPFGH